MTTHKARHLRRSVLDVPDSEERKLVKAQTQGKGVVAMDGMLLEPPVIAMKELILERARRAR